MPRARGELRAALRSQHTLPPRPGIGFNTTTQALIASCPSRKYHRCFFKQLEAKYPVTQYRLPTLPKRCTSAKGVAALSDPECTLPPVERVLNHVAGPRLGLCRRPPPAPPVAERLRCGSSTAAVAAARTVLLLGVPSSPGKTGTERRAAIRASWLRDERVGSRAVVCFLLSSRTPAAQLAPMQREQATHADMLFLDSPETPWLIRNNTKYSGFLRRGRGMPTFKQ